MPLQSCIIGCVYKTPYRKSGQILCGISKSYTAYLWQKAHTFHRFPEEDPFVFWKVNQPKFPRLAKMACRYLYHQKAARDRGEDISLISVWIGNKQDNRLRFEFLVTCNIQKRR